MSHTKVFVVSNSNQDSTYTCGYEICDKQAASTCCISLSLSLSLFLSTRPPPPNIFRSSLRACQVTDEHEDDAAAAVANAMPRLQIVTVFCAGRGGRVTQPRKGIGHALGNQPGRLGAMLMAVAGSGMAGRSP